MTPIATLVMTAALLSDLGPIRHDAEGVPLPPGAIARLGSTRFRHVGDEGVTFFTQDGRTLVNVSRIGEVSACDVATGLRTFEYRLGTNVLGAAPIHEKQVVMLVRNRDQCELHERDLTTGQVHRRHSLGDMADGYALAADGSRFAVKLGGIAQIFDSQTLKPVGETRFSISDIDSRQLILSPDGKWIAAAIGQDWTEVREVTTGNMPFAAGVEGGRAFVAAIAFSPDARQLARVVKEADDHRERIELIDLKTETVRTIRQTRFINEAHDPGTVCFSPDGRSVYSTIGRELAESNLATGQTTSLGPAYRVRQLLFSPDGNTLAALGAHTATVWDRKTRRKLAQSSDAIDFESHTMEFTRDSKSLTVSSDQRAQLFEMASRRMMHDVSRPDAISVCYSAGTTRYALRLPDRVEVRDRLNDRVRFTQPAPDTICSQIGLNREGTMVFCDDSKQFFGWNLGTNQKIGPYRSWNSRWYVLPDGQQALEMMHTTDQRYEWNIVKLATGQAVPRASKLITTEPRLVIHPGGGELLMKQGPVVGLFDLRRHRQRWQLPITEVVLDGANFSPDGRMLAINHASGLKIWEVSSGRLRTTLRLPTPARATAFSPDHSLLAVLSETGPIELWDLRNTHKNWPKKLDADTTTALWRMLLEPNAERAFSALQQLAAAAETTVPFVRQKISAERAPDPERVARLLAELAAPAFRDREQATQELKKLGPVIEQQLHDAEEATDSPEVQQRLEKILLSIAPESPESVQRSRIVELIAWCGTADAKKLLQEWAAGAPGARLTREAAAALEAMPTDPRKD